VYKSPANGVQICTPCTKRRRGHPRREPSISLSDLAAIGSFISGVAVVVSFVFLAVQLRQNARNQRAIMHIERTALV